MKYLLLLSLCIFLSSCSTALFLSSQDECERENKTKLEKDRRDCGNMNDVIEAVREDTQSTKEAAKYAKEEYLTKDDASVLAHEGEDSNLCPSGQSKVCTASNGCKCSNSQQ